MKLALLSLLALLALVLDGAEAGSKKFGRPVQEHQHRLLAKRASSSDVTPAAKSPFTSWASKDGLVGFAPHDVVPAFKLPDVSVVDTQALQKALDFGYSLLSAATALLGDVTELQTPLEVPVAGAVAAAADAKKADQAAKDKKADAKNAAAGANAQAGADSTADAKDKPAAALLQADKLLKASTLPRSNDDILPEAAETLQEDFQEGYALFKETATTLNNVVPGGIAQALTGALTSSSSLKRQNQTPEILDLASLVNPFIGTSIATYGNVFPGASVPFGMAKIGIDLDNTYAPSGYNDDPNAPVRGMSLLHDSGTGSSAGSYGNFESMPIVCPGGFENCPVSLDARAVNRTIPGKDIASPGYFSTTLKNGMQMEATSTRRAGLIRYTYPLSTFAQLSGGAPTIVFDCSNDLPGTWRGGQCQLDKAKGRIMLSGTWGSSFASGLFSYKAHACYDVTNGGANVIEKAGLWAADRFGMSVVDESKTYENLTRNTIGGQPIQTGAVVSFKQYPQVNGLDAQITIRAGVSFVSAEQACQNAESEVPAFDFDAVVAQSRALWNEKLNRVQISNETNSTIATMLYSSLYRASLTPNNATGETQGAFVGTKAPYFDSLYCTWDTFRTFWPWNSLTSPREFGEVTATYLDAYDKEGHIPECRANNVPGLTQGGSSGTNVIADLAVKYAKYAPQLGVSLDLAWEALRHDAFTTPPEWNNFGRQIDVFRRYGYVPFAVFTNSTGRQTREASRTLEYAYNDFGIRNVALLLGKSGGELDALNAGALAYKNTFNKDIQSRGYSNFVAKRRVDGSFPDLDPTTCSPIDPDPDSVCSLQQENTSGTYESSSWEYSLFAPQDYAGLIKLLAGDSRENFIKRVDEFFSAGIYLAGNEPSFQTPIVYHYANAPALSAERVRQVVARNFGAGGDGIPGNDDQGAMATLLLFHLAGLYPVPSTREFLIVSPFVPQYTIRNELLGSFTMTAQGFDSRSLGETRPDDARLYVESVAINGVVQSSRCRIDFEQLLPGGGAHTEITLTMTADKASANSCGGSDADLPSSLSTGGFAKF